MDRIEWWNLYDKNWDYFVSEFGFFLTLGRYCRMYGISEPHKANDSKDGKGILPNSYQLQVGGTWKMNADSYARFWANKGVFMGKDKKC